MNCVLCRGSISAKSIQSANSRLSKLITNYNAQLWNPPFLSVTIAEVRNPDSTLWANVPVPHHNLIPHAIQVKLVELTAKQMHPYYVPWCWKLHVRCVPPSYLISFNRDSAVAYLITLHMWHTSYLRNLLQACIQVRHHGNSLLVQFQACCICCFCAIALHRSAH